MSELQERVRTALGARYAIEQEIGHGGMAVVYRARDLRHARPVAIKVFNPGVVGGEDAPLRFLQEIRIAARLAHPHVLPLHDSGEIRSSDDAAPLLYYVMPYVAGASLRERLRDQQRLDVDEAVTIARTVASALDHAHRRNVLHRDVKPENILLQEGEALVADFGVARAVEEAGVETRTLPGLAVGTPAYMSPEQASGDERVDGRSDQYALACVLFEMLAGRPPFVGNSIGRVIQQHLQAPPPSLRSFRPEAPVTIDPILTRALAKDPAGRYQTAQEMLQALKMAAAAETLERSTDVNMMSTLPGAMAPMTPAPAARAEPSAGAGKERRLVILLGAVAAIAIAALVVVLLTR